MAQEHRRRRFNERWVDCAAAESAYQRLSAQQSKFKELTEIGGGILARIRGREGKGVILHTRLMLLTSIESFAKRADILPETLLANGDGMSPLQEPIAAPPSHRQGQDAQRALSPQEAIVVYDKLVAHLDTQTEWSVVDPIAGALGAKANVLNELGRHAEAIAVYDDLLARFGSTTKLTLRKQVAWALACKGITLHWLGRHAEAIAVFDDLLARFGSATELPLRKRVAFALADKGRALCALDRHAEAIAVFDDLLARFGSATELPLREWFAQTEARQERLRKS